MSDDNNSFTENSLHQEELSPIRDQLVNTAVSFLLNPEVQRKNEDSKIEFLKKKGLTNAEITAAFEKCKFDPRYGRYSSPDHLSKPVAVPQIYQQPYTFWSRLSGFSSSLIIFGVAIYGLHYFYKKYIKPWILEEDSEEITLNKNLLKLTENLTALTDTVDKLQKLVTKQNEEISRIIQIENSGYAPTPIILEEMKREISSLKSILISRHQFPAVPQVQSVRATIPSWQLVDNRQNEMVSEAENKPVDLVTNPKSAIDSSGIRNQDTEVSEASLDLNSSIECSSLATNNLPNGTSVPNCHLKLNEKISNDVNPESVGKNFDSEKA